MDEELKALARGGLADATDVLGSEVELPSEGNKRVTGVFVVSGGSGVVEVGGAEYSITASLLLRCSVFECRPPRYLDKVRVEGLTYTVLTAERILMSDSWRLSLTSDMR